MCSSFVSDDSLFLGFFENIADELPAKQSDDKYHNIHHIYLLFSLNQINKCTVLSLNFGSDLVHFVSPILHFSGLQQVTISFHDNKLEARATERVEELRDGAGDEFGYIKFKPVHAIKPIDAIYPIYIV